jgi:hypothetical protein
MGLGVGLPGVEQDFVGPIAPARSRAACQQCPARGLAGAHPGRRRSGRSSAGGLPGRRPTAGGPAGCRAHSQAPGPARKPVHLGFGKPSAKWAASAFRVGVRERRSRGNAPRASPEHGHSAARGGASSGVARIAGVIPRTGPSRVGSARHFIASVGGRAASASGLRMSAIFAPGKAALTACTKGLAVASAWAASASCARAFRPSSGRRRRTRPTRPSARRSSPAAAGPSRAARSGRAPGAGSKLDPAGGIARQPDARFNLVQQQHVALCRGSGRPHGRRWRRPASGLRPAPGQPRTSSGPRVGADGRPGHRAHAPCRHRRPAGRAPGRPPAGCGGRGLSVSFFTSVSGSGRSATWVSRITAISAAIIAFGASATSSIAFSSICHIRVSARIGRRAAMSSPRVVRRAASVGSSAARRG